MRTLGRKYLAAWAGGVSAAVLAGVFAVIGWLEIAIAALAVTVLALLVTSALSRMAPYRRESRPSSGRHTTVDIGHVVEGVVLAEHVRTQQYISRELEQRSAWLVQHVEALVDTRLPRVATEVLAALRLSERYGDLGLASPPGPTASETLALLDAIRSLRPRRVLVIGAHGGTSWMGLELQSLGGRGTVLVDDDAALARLTNEIRSHGLEAALKVVHPPRSEPAVLHGVLPWYDLSALPDEDAADLVIIGWAGLRALRATLPVLPLILERLTPEGVVAVVCPEQQDELVKSWTAGHDVAVDPELSSAGVAVLRRTDG